MGAEEFGTILAVKFVLWGLWHPKLRYVASVGKDFGGQRELLGILGDHFGTLGYHLETLGDHLGTIWGPLGIIWGPLGTIWGPLGIQVRHLGGPKGQSIKKTRFFMGFQGVQGSPRDPRL